MNNDFEKFDYELTYLREVSELNDKAKEYVGAGGRLFGHPVDINNPHELIAVLYALLTTEVIKNNSLRERIDLL